MRYAFPSYLARITDARIRTNAAWSFAGHTFYAATQWVMIVALARVTSAETVGTLALALAITGPVMTFFNMQLRAVIATDVSGKYAFADYLRTRLVTTLVALAATGVCVVALGQSRPTMAVVVLVGLSKASESVSDIIYGYWQLVERLDVVGKSLVIRGILTLAAFTTAVMITRSLLWGAASLLAGSLGVLFGYDFRHMRRATTEFASSTPEGQTSQMEQAGKLIRLAAPLGLVAMLIALNSAVPRYFIEGWRGAHDLGIYSALASFIVVGNLVVNAIGQASVSRLARLHALPKQAGFLKLLGGLLSASAFMGVLSMIAALAFGRQILSIYGKEYAESYTVFLIIVGVASVGYFLAVFNYALTAIGAYKAQVPLFVGITATLAVLCRFSVPEYGIAGAAGSLLAAGILQAGASAALLGFRIYKRTMEIPCETC